MKKIVSCMILLAVFLLTLFSVGCRSLEKDPTGSSEATDGETLESVSPLYVIANGMSDYELILSENADQALSDLTLTLRDEIQKKLGYRMKLSSDWLSWEESAGTYEILIGETNRPESAEILQTLDYHDFVICTVDSKIIILGGNEEATQNAVLYFTEHCVELLSAFPGDYSYLFRETYPVTNLTLCGRDISEYTIYYPSNAPSCLDYATQLRGVLGEMCGTALPITTTRPESGSLIVIGDRSANENIASDSYSVTSAEGNISILAGSRYAYWNALRLITNRLKSLSGEATLSSSDMTFQYDLPSREEYIQNPEDFLPVWNGILDLAEPMTWEEKIAAFTSADDETLLVGAHRGEHTYYPDNSIEAVISAWKAGAFMVELDVRKTADGVLILMHDGTLERMTNYSEVKGTVVNGVQLPTTPDVSAWTYEQIQQLYLKAGLGGSTAAVTSYRVATLEEVLQVTNNRIFVYPDIKINNYDFTNDLYPLMKKTGNYRSVLIGGSGNSVQVCVDFQKKVAAETGVEPLLYVRAGSANAQAASNYMNSYSQSNSAILLNGEYYTEKNAEIVSAINKIKTTTKIGGWTLLDTNQNSKTWEEMYGTGFRLIMTDKFFDLIHFAQQKNAAS